MKSRCTQFAWAIGTVFAWTLIPSDAQASHCLSSATVGSWAYNEREGEKPRNERLLHY